MPNLLQNVTTTTDSLPLGQWVALVALAVLAWRLVLIVAFPYGPHRPCKGTGKRKSGKYWRDCRGCKGTGRKIRPGRRIWNWATGKESVR